MGKLGIKLPPVPEGMTPEEYAEQGYGYPEYAHQEESNAPETGREPAQEADVPADGPPPEEPPVE